MTGPRNEEAERERKFAGEEGIPVERYRERIDEIEEGQLEMENVRDFVSLLRNRPTRQEDVKVMRIKQKIESEKKKAEEYQAGANKYTRWMTVFDARFGNQRSMEVEVDEGSIANFLTIGMAADRGFEVQSRGSEPFRCETVNGDVVCEEYVELTLVGKEGQAIVAEFYILPANEPPNDPRITKPLVGRRLLQEPGDVLLTEDPRDPIWSTKMGPKNAYMQEESKHKAAEVQAYQAQTAQSRDAARKNQDGKDQNQHNRGSSSGTKNEHGK